MSLTRAINVALRDALIEDEQLIADLDDWKNEPAVFTRRPLPNDAPQRVVIVNPQTVPITDEDGLTSDRPVVVRDIGVYGKKGPAGDPSDQTRDVEAMGDRIRDLFHRQRFSVRPEGFSVIDIVARGPFVAPVDDDEDVGRIVSLTIRLRRTS